MHSISPLRLGVAFGLTGVIFYVLCMLFMATFPAETVIWLSNSLLHGFDITTIMRDNVPYSQSLVGILGTFVGGWIFGFLAASIHNLGLKRDVAN